MKKRSTFKLMVIALMVVVLFAITATDVFASSEDMPEEANGYYEYTHSVDEDSGEEYQSYLGIVGKDRFATSVLVANLLAEEGVDASTVVLASGENFADALSASNLGAPVLLTKKNSLPDSVKSFLTESTTIKKVIVVGGEAAVSEEVVASLPAEMQVERLAGANRYATNMAVIRHAGGMTDKAALVVSGINFPDALAAGAVANANHAVSEGGRKALLVLTRPDSIPEETLEAVRREAAEIFVVGGEAAISHKAASTLGGSYIRLAGANRYETARAVSNYFIAAPAAKVVVVSGRNFPDALAAAPLANFKACGLEFSEDLADVYHQQIIAVGSLAAARGEIGTGDGIIAIPVPVKVQAEQFCSACREFMLTPEHNH